MLRQEANKKILEKLAIMIEKYPDMRFGQLLVNLNIIQTDYEGRIMDPFFKESVNILEDINNALKRDW